MKQSIIEMLEMIEMKDNNNMWIKDFDNYIDNHLQSFLIFTIFDDLCFYLNELMIHYDIILLVWI